MKIGPVLDFLPTIFDIGNTSVTHPKCGAHTYEKGHNLGIRSQLRIDLRSVTFLVEMTIIYLKPLCDEKSAT